jgi:S1-C subfamily serine protease
MSTILSRSIRLTLLTIGILPSLRTPASAAELGAVGAQAGPAIVRLSELDNNDKESASGSGFLIREDGIVVTNHHVIDDVDGRMVAVFKDGHQVRVMGVLADDEAHDLALVRIEGKGHPVLPLAEEADIRNGMNVIALGSPLGFDQSLSTGIISALRDDYPADWKERDPKLKDKAGPLIQHTAPIAPGSSGSPLLNDAGQVVGVNHSGFGDTSLFFAAHVTALRALVAKTDLSGKPRRLGPDVKRNLMISAGVFALLIAGWFLGFRMPRRSRRERAQSQRH